MRAVTIAAAGAAVITTVSAASHVKHMHAKLHANVARDTWVDWNATTTSSDSDMEVDPKTTKTTSTTPVAAATTTTSSYLWEDWTTTSSLEVDPATTSTTTSSFEHTWADWTTSSAVPVDPATTSTEEHTWADWTSSVPVDPASTSTEEHTWADWTSSVPVDPASTTTEEHTWGDWTTSDPVDPASTATETWGDWESAEPTTTITVASTVTTTKYVEPISTDSATWADWESSSEVAAVTSVITSTVGWSSGGWFGPSWTVDPGSCAVSIITSYGAPTWYPTPAAAETTSTPETTWADWTTTSSEPAAETSTTETWADWTSTSDPAAATSTETWSDWTSAETETATAVPSSGGNWAPQSSGNSWAPQSSSGPRPSGGPGGGSPGISANGDSWGMTYSPYTASGGCKDAGTVAQDMAVLAQKGFSSVRVYSTDCSTLENIGQSARDNGLRLILGVWISATGIGAAKGQVDDIVAWGQWDLVELIVVGNEAVFNGFCSAKDLADFVSSSAGAFKAAGYTGLVTTTEPLSVWEDTNSAAAFCGAVDVVGANLYAFFNSGVTADKAGGFIQDQINILNTVCGGKPVYVLESGWPHAGNCNGAACPSPSNQAVALKGIQETVGAQVVFLSFEDEPWKQPGEFGVEQFWGCASVF